MEDYLISTSRVEPKTFKDFAVNVYMLLLRQRANNAKCYPVYEFLLLAATVR